MSGWVKSVCVCACVCACVCVRARVSECAQLPFGLLRGKEGKKGVLGEV